MSCCVKIKIQDAEVKYPALTNRYGSPLYFDLSESDLPLFSSDYLAVNDEETLFKTIALGFNLPDTPKNYAIQAFFISPNLVEREDIPITVQIRDTFETMTLLRILQWQEKIGAEVELHEGRGSVLEMLKDCRICDLFEGETFVLNQQTYDDLINLGGEYDSSNPADKGYRFMIADTGKWYDNSTTNKRIRLEDLILVFSEAYILQKAFCQCAAHFFSHTFGELFNRQWAELLPNKFWATANTNLFSPYALALSATQGIGYYYLDPSFGNYFHFDTTNNDPSGSYYQVPTPIPPAPFTSGVCYQSHNDVPFCLRFCMKAIIVDGAGQDRFISIILKNLPVNTSPVLAESAIIKIPANDGAIVNICIEYNISPGEVVIPQIQSLQALGVASLFVANPAHYTFEQCDGFLYKDATYDVKDFINCNYTAYNLLKGVIHKLNSKFVEDTRSQTFEMKPMTTTAIDGVQLEGYYKSKGESFDATPIVVCDSRAVQLRTSEQCKEYILQFKDSTDAYILNHLEKGNFAYQPYSYNKFFINKSDCVTINANPFFEPTMEKEQTELIISNSGQAQPAVWLPAIYDNLDGKRTEKYSPRTFICYDTVSQYIPSTQAGYVGNFWFEQQTNGALFYFTQTPTPTIYIFGTAIKPKKYNLIYGNNLVTNENGIATIRKNTLYETFWRKQIADIYNAVHQFFAIIDYTTFKSIKPQQLWKIFYKDVPAYYRIKSLTGVHPCNTSKVQVELIPDIALLAEVCCELPCDGEFVEAVYYMDFRHHFPQGNPLAYTQNLYIDSFTINGSEYLPGCNPLNVSTCIGWLGDSNAIVLPNNPVYVTNLVDALNSLGLPFLSFYYDDSLLPYVGQQYSLPSFKIKYPACWQWQFSLKTGGRPVANAGYIAYNNNGVFFGNGATNLLAQLPNTAYTYGEPFNVITTYQC